MDIRLVIRALTNILLNGLERTTSGGQVIIQLNQGKENHSISSGYKTHYGLELTFA